MLKDLVKIADNLDKIGCNKEADAIDRIIRKIASEDSDFETDLFNKSIKISYDELEAWINKLELRYGDEESPYNQFDIDIDEEEWTVFYNIRNEEDCVAVKGYDSIGRSKKRWDRIEKDFRYVCDKVKENFGGDNHNVIGGIGDNCGLIFRVGDRIYSMKSAFGGTPNLELEILGRKVWGETTDFEFDPEYMTSQEFAGVEWIVYNWT